MTKTFNVVQELRQHVPELEPLYAEHIDDYDELLPHVFMADVTRLVEELDAKHAHGSLRSGEVVDRILRVLERAMATGDTPAKELIAASFIEVLDRDSPRFRALSLRLGDALAEELEKQRGRYGDDRNP